MRSVSWFSIASLQLAAFISTLPTGITTLSIGHPRVENTYDAADNLTTSVYQHQGPQGTRTVSAQHYYDFAGCSEDVYNGRGQVESKYKGGSGYTSPTSYDDKDLFQLQLYRDASPTGASTTPRYNGDIVGVASQVRGRKQLLWKITYDEYDRMRTSWQYERTDAQSSPGSPTDLVDPYYDKRGNITYLSRYGTVPDGNGGFERTWFDGLSYTYPTDDNCVASIDDSYGSSPYGYREGGGGNYLYDDNGNTTHDPGRDVDITYNHLDLPEEIVWANGQKLVMTYDAGGTLLRRRQVSSGGSTLETRDYVGGMEYVNNALESVYHEEGRIKFSGTSQEWQYSIVDHLGNTRLVYADLNNNGIPEVPTEIIQENHYYPFGMKMEGPWMGASSATGYQYNGIEHVDEFDLNVNMAFYRTLDPTTGRWWQVDPKAEAIKSHSPYESMGNAPMSNSDPRGDLFFAIPQIGFNNGGLSIGLEIGFGVPGVASISATVGYSGGGAYWSAQAYAAGFYLGYGSGGAFAGIGYLYSGFSGGATYNFSTGDIGINASYGKTSKAGFGGSIGVGYSQQNGFSLGVSGSYTQFFEKPTLESVGSIELEGAPGDIDQQRESHDCLLQACTYLDAAIGMGLTYEEIKNAIGDLYTPGEGTSTEAALKELYGDAAVSSSERLLPNRLKSSGIIVAKNKNHAIVLTKVEFFKASYKYAHQGKTLSRMKLTFADPATGRIYTTGLRSGYRAPSFYIRRNWLNLLFEKGAYAR